MGWTIRMEESECRVSMGRLKSESSADSVRDSIHEQSELSAPSRESRIIRVLDG